MQGRVHAKEVVPWHAHAYSLPKSVASPEADCGSLKDTARPATSNRVADSA